MFQDHVQEILLKCIEDKSWLSNGHHALLPHLEEEICVFLLDIFDCGAATLFLLLERGSVFPPLDA